MAWAENKRAELILKIKIQLQLFVSILKKKILMHEVIRICQLFDRILYSGMNS